VTPQRDNVTTLGAIIDFAVAEDVPVDLTNLLQWPADLSIQSMPEDSKSVAALYLRAEIGRCLERGMEATAEQIAMIISFMNATSRDSA